MFGCPKSFTVQLVEGEASKKVRWKEPVFKDNVNITHFWRSRVGSCLFVILALLVDFPSLEVQDLLLFYLVEDFTFLARLISLALLSDLHTLSTKLSYFKFSFTSKLIPLYLSHPLYLPHHSHSTTGAGTNADRWCAPYTLCGHGSIPESGKVLFHHHCLP